MGIDDDELDAEVVLVIVVEVFIDGWVVVVDVVFVVFMVVLLVGVVLFVVVVLDWYTFGCSINLLFCTLLYINSSF